jgi:RNA polymerase sigma-70 factor, ECF subfamily
MAPLLTEDDFQREAEPYRRELQAHCYRMVGSVHDAEDLAQEALARAWNRREGFEGRASVKTWLYKIATHACLDALEKRPPRGLPTRAGPASEPDRPPAAPGADPVWLTPAPEALVAATAPGPEARYTARESVALAFLAALQLLPPKQRAVLLLRDVLGWQAAEAAELLELSVASVNSALQRARATLESERARGWEESVKPPEDAPTRSLLQRYMRAWEEADLNGLIALLREDASFAMPPMPSWYQGRAAIRTFIAASLLAGDAKGRFRMRPTTANGQPAVAIYQLDTPSGIYRGFAVQLLEVSAGEIASMTTFIDAALFPRFALPSTLEG